MEYNFTRGEPDSLVFISSVMDDELNKARCIVQKVFREFPITRPWAFEFTPASSTSPEDEYLEKVKRADFVVWLVGSKTTLPVVNEIHTCMNNSRRLLIFKLPTNDRDKQTMDLLSDVNNYAKWKEVDDITDLAKHVKDAISDEIVKALQEPALPARKNKIQESYRNSLSRCKQMWRTLNVPENIATELSEDTSVGDLLGSPCSGLYVVFGNQGSGKTLAAERLFQRWLKQSLDDSSQPFPLFINSRDLNEPLNEYINRMTQGYSSPAIQGVAIIIDGIDEIGITRANELIKKIKVFAGANPKSIIIITSRQLPGLKAEDVEQINLPTMDEEQIIGLISKMTGCAFDKFAMHEWSKSIQDAIRYPLFAIMMGIELRNNSNFTATRPNQLVNLLAQKAAKDAEEKDWLLHCQPNGGIPLVCKSWDGNASDTKIFEARAADLIAQFQGADAPRYLVADAKLYTKDNAPNLSRLSFITRLPETIKVVGHVIEQAWDFEAWDFIDASLAYQRVELSHYGISQRWLVVYSKQAEQRAKKTLHKAQKREQDTVQKALFHLQAQRFNAQQEAQKALVAIAKKLKYHRIEKEHIKPHIRYAKKGRPTPKTPIKDIRWQITADILPDQEKIQAVKQRKATFVIGSNIPHAHLSDQDIIQAIKDKRQSKQASVF